MRRILRSALPFLLLSALLPLIPAVGQVPAPAVARRLWLAGRYDGNRIVVFFDAVKFNGTVPRAARALTEPVTLGFLSQQELSPDYTARLPRKPGMERFRPGDQYDLLMGDGRSTTVTLTTPVGYVSDDEDDDPSYIGALAKVNDVSALLGTRGYYALRRRSPNEQSARESLPPPAAGPKPRAGVFDSPPERDSRIFASLVDEPVRFDLETQIEALLTGRLQESASDTQKREIGSIAPKLAVQTFRLADGSLRYYARVEWRKDDTPQATPEAAFGAWIAPGPVLHIMAVEQPTSPYGFLYELPTLLNVIDLGDGTTGIIADISGPGDSALGLWEYRDGADLGHMRLFQSLTMDE